MANFDTLKAAIVEVVKTNGNNEITGASLQQSLLAMVDSLGTGYQFKGGAVPSTDPGTPDQKVAYFAGPGTYPNFGPATIPDGYVGFFYGSGSTWSVATAKTSTFTAVTVASDIIQLMDGTTPVYPRTRAEAVFFGNDQTDTLDEKVEEIEGNINQLGQEVDTLAPLESLLSRTDNIFNKDAIVITNANLGIRNSGSSLVTKSAPYNNIYLGQCLSTDVLRARLFFDGTLLETFGIETSQLYCTDGPIEAGTILSSHDYLGGTYKDVGPITAGATKYYLNINFSDAQYNTEQNIRNLVDTLVVTVNKNERPSEYIPFSTFVSIKDTDLSPELREKVNTEYVEENQGIENAGKILTVGNDGKVVPSSGGGQYVEKNQGAGNYGKYLAVGENGIVTLADGTGGGSVDTANCVKKEMTRTFYLGADLLNGVTYTLGAGWTKTADGFSYSKANGGGNLEFDFTSVSNTNYIVKMAFGALSPFGLFVRFGTGVKADPYNGGTESVVGLVGNGQKLIVEPNVGAATEFNSTLIISLHNIVDEAQSVTSATISKRCVTAGTMVKDLSGFWNVAIGAANTLGKSVSGSRNIGIGEYAMEEFVGGERCIAIGTFAMGNVQYGTRSIAIGADCIYYTKEIHETIAIGASAYGNSAHLNDTISDRNISVGDGAFSNVYGNVSNNVAIGHEAGAQAGNKGTGSPNKNVLIGSRAGYYSGNMNVLIGYRAGYGCKGDKNVLIGDEIVNSSNKYAVNSVLIGQGISLSGDYVTNSIAIGQGITVDNSNQIKIGNSRITDVVIAGKRIVFNNDNTVTWQTIS